MIPEVITVYVCPTEGCQNYYGSSGMNKLEETWNTDMKGDRTHLRSRCPNCGQLRVFRYARLIPPEEVQAAQSQVYAQMRSKAV